VSGTAWAAVSGVGFGLFQSLNRVAGRGIASAYVSTFIQLAIAAVVLVVASAATADLSVLEGAGAWALLAFAAAGILHFLAGWTFLNLSQQRIGAARTAPLLTLTPLFGLVVALVSLGQLPSAGALAAIVPMMAGAYLVAGGRGGEVRPADAVFALGCAAMWAISPVLTLHGLEGVDSPLLGVTIGMLASVAAYAALLARRGEGLALGDIGTGALAAKLLAGVLVALATWTRWLALDDAAVGVVLALGLLNVPIVLFLAPRLAGRHLERVSARVRAGAALVLAGSLALIAVG
jgi:drug/metabolite transporter (DMT)-like permease